MKKLVLLCLVLSGYNLSSQTTCESSKNLTNDLNIISVKRCLIKSNQETVSDSGVKSGRKVGFKKSNSNRFMTVRSIRKKEEVLGLHNSITTSGLYKNNAKSMEIESLLAFPKSYKKIENFSTVDRLPVFENCQKKKNKKSMNSCFNYEMIHFVNDNIEYPEEAIDAGVNGKIAIKFVIDEKGEINNVRVTGDKKTRSLKEEVIDLIHMMPKLKPAVKDNENVPVEFEFMLNFTL